MKLEYNLDFINDKKSESQIKKAVSYLEKAFYSGKETRSFFLDPFEINIIKTIAKKNNISIKFLGGNENCERKVFIANPNNNSKRKYIKILKSNFSGELKHPDVLGAILSLELTREKIGDIIVFDNFLEVAITEEDADYVKYNLTKINKVSVNLTIKENNELDLMPLSYKAHFAFISSLRLDNIVSEVINISRSKAKEMIQKKKVKVDFLYRIDPSYIINTGSMISISHFGRFIFDEVIGQSKKGNYRIKYREVV